MNIITNLNDAFGHILFVTLITSGFLTTPIFFWFMFIWCVQHRIFVTDKLIEQNWLNFFEILKCISVIISCLEFTFFYYFNVYYYDIIYYTLLLNILEAVIEEIRTSFTNFINALVGLILIFSIPYEPYIPSNVSYFTLPHSWILLYTLWNANFSYRLNFSWSTRLVLIAPILLCLCHNNSKLWLVTRSYSLCLNMILRSTQMGRFYRVDSKCFITNLVNYHNPTIYYIWSFVNLVVALSL